MFPFILVDGRLLAVGRIVGVYGSVGGGCEVTLYGEEKPLKFPDITVKAFKDLLEAHITPKVTVKTSRINFGETYVVNNEGLPQVPENI